MKSDTKEYLIQNEAAWAELMPGIVEHLGKRDLILLEGELGSGKTTFVKHLLHYLSCIANVDSPSFAIVNEYECPSLLNRYGSQCVYHLDLYRINETEELIEAGIEELLYRPGLKLIEWPDIAEPILPDEYAKLKFTYFSGGRKLVIL